MKHELTTDVDGVASHALLCRLLFVYSLNGVVKCFSADELRPLESAMMHIGWKHTATIDPARWIEAMINGKYEPSAMLAELLFYPPNAESRTPETESITSQYNQPPGTVMVPSRFAQKLERERDEARREAIRWQDAWMNETTLQEMGNTVMPWMHDWKKSQEND